jgi:hypothetical protein
MANKKKKKVNRPGGSSRPLTSHTGGGGLAPTTTLARAGGKTKRDAFYSDSDPETSQPPLKKKTKEEPSESESESSSEDESVGSSLAASYEFVKYGANQSETWHYVPKGSENKEGKNKMEKLYGGTSHAREKRSYASQREKQALRWLSTVLFKKYGGEEIQTYYDEANDRIVVSSNKNTVNNKMRTDFASNTGLDEIPGQTREGRHSDKLRAGDKYATQNAIKDAVKNYRFFVPPSVESGRDGLHAERRIKEHVESEGDEMDLSHLGGVKRPCAVCTVALDIMDSARAGPLWPSDSALKGYTKEQIQQHLIDNDVPTHVTRDRVTGKLTTGHDTDSESEAETYPDGGWESD